jgi:hypothetical protein
MLPASKGTAVAPFVASLIVYVRPAERDYVLSGHLVEVGLRKKARVQIDGIFRNKNCPIGQHAVGSPDHEWMIDSVNQVHKRRGARVEILWIDVDCHCLVSCVSPTNE